jgi:RsiW-degrading membrane proteinase PrsW (M82 family)
MTPSTFLSIASFAISLGGLVPVFFLKNRTKDLALAVVVAALVGTTSVALFHAYQHEMMISRVKGEIIEELAYDTLIFDQIYLELHYVPLTVVSEALFQAVEEGIVEHQMIEFQKDARIVQVRGYYVAGK